MRSIETNSTCPVCGYRPLDTRDFNICPSCGVEFGIDTVGHTYEELRSIWKENGPVWSSDVDSRPIGWNPWLQLIQAGHAEAVPFVAEINIPQRYSASGGIANISPTPMYVVRVT